MIDALEVFANPVKPVAMRGLLAREGLESGVAYNPVSGEVARDPYAVYRRLREKDPVHRMRLVDAWVLTRYEDADAMLRDHERFGAEDRRFYDAGLTYSPNMVNDDNHVRVDAETGHHDGFEGAAVYSGKFGDVGFAVGGGMTAYQGPNDGSADDKSEWLVGARIDFGGGFRVSAAHKRVTDDDEAAQGQVTDVGVRFVTGANSFSLTGSQAEMDDSGDKRTRIMGSYARSMGPGVKVHTNLLHIDGESGDGQASSSGLVSISGIKVVF